MRHGLPTAGSCYTLAQWYACYMLDLMSTKHAAMTTSESNQPFPTNTKSIYIKTHLHTSKFYTSFQICNRLQKKFMSTLSRHSRMTIHFLFTIDTELTLYRYCAIVPKRRKHFCIRNVAQKRSSLSCSRGVPITTSTPQPIYPSVLSPNEKPQPPQWFDLPF